MPVMESIPHVPGVAIINLGYAILQLFEPFMKEPEVGGLCEELGQWINKVQRRTILPDAQEKLTTG